MEKKMQFQDRLLDQTKAHLMSNPTHRLPKTRNLARLCHDTVKDDYLKQPKSSSSFNEPFQNDLGRELLQSFVDRLEFDHQFDRATNDMSQLLRIIYTLSVPFQDRVLTLITSQKLNCWIKDSTSQALHVNGNMYQSEDKTRQSPLSYVCAKLVQSTLLSTTQSEKQAEKGTFTICWFCGQHMDMDKDPDAHPKGMMNNLLAQLITQLLDYRHLPSLDKIDLPDEDLELSTLCEVFSSLVKRLASGTTFFCVIDGINYYEDAARREDSWKVLSMLLKLTRSGQIGKDGCLIKLLVTSPKESSLQRDMYPAVNVYDMDQYPVFSGGSNALQWDLTLRGG